MRRWKKKQKDSSLQKWEAWSVGGSAAWRASSIWPIIAMTALSLLIKIPRLFFLLLVSDR